MLAKSGYLRLFLVSVLLGGIFVRADNPAFDLSGPRLEVKVTRAGKTLPVSQVPNLQPGDRMWIHPLLPSSQSVHYLLVVAFLRGSTNPPPENWFTRAETWNKLVREGGIFVTVPQDAQQALLLLAPQTGGDFNTLRSTVRGKPGAFVRASQDLNQASLDRSRLDRYLDIIKQTSSTEPEALHERSVLLARSLNMKLDKECFDKPSEQQAPCLMQNTGQLVLEDGHSQSMVAALTSGPNSDLIGVLSTTKQAGGGAYSPYVGAFMDVARIMENLHTAEFQYIPALALSKDDVVELKLNNPPSFRKPKSVIVVGLPAVEAAQFPPLRPVDSKQVFCLEQPALVLPVEGAPLVFSTGYAHDLVLRVKEKSGLSADLPVHADAARGGVVIDTHTLRAGLDAELTGTVRGYWGFEAFDGPNLHLRSAHTAKWTMAAADASALVVGREDVLHMQADDAACVDQVSIKDEHGKTAKAVWKLTKPNELEVKVPLKDATPGRLTMLVKKHGLAQPDEIPLQTYSEAGRLDNLVIHAGDQHGVLIGTRLDEVAGLEVNGVHFAPAGLRRAQQKDELKVSAPSAQPAVLQQDQKLLARVALKDGRVLELQTTVAAARPKVSIIGKSVQTPQGASRSAIRLANQDDLPQNGLLSFFLKAETPATFPRSEKIEVAAEDDSFHVLLSFADGNLTLQDPKTVLAVLDPLKSFGPSAFGPLRFRPVDANGTAGDWQPLANLVRIPTLKEIRCPDSPDKQCTLSGTNLYLIDSVASDAAFTHAVPVPVGFADSTLAVPRPNGTLLYLKLRDDPAAVNAATLPVLPEE
ncbi:MAG: hypothetical protein ABR866_03110 [Candidatus Korobacteraceae bacterium]|jgi:hypothetical protein